MRIAILTSEAGPFAKVGVAFEAEVASQARDGGVHGHPASVVGQEEPARGAAEDGSRHESKQQRGPITHALLRPSPFPGCRSG
jgi:hypothetical protein